MTRRFLTLAALAAVATLGLAAGCGSDGYTPEDRAAQLVANIEKHNGQAHAEIKCGYASRHGDTRAWYLCQPGSYEVSCVRRTTDKPRTGPGDRGDCFISRASRPSVLGLTVAQAHRLLGAAGLRFMPIGVNGGGRAYTFEPDWMRNMRSWVVCWQRRSPGGIVRFWAAPTCVFTMPTLTGKTRRAAEKALAARGLEMWDVHVDPEYNDSSELLIDLPGYVEGRWIVCSQHPRPGTRVSVSKIRSSAKLEFARIGHCP